MPVRQFLLALFAIGFSGLFGAGTASAVPLNEWQISCSVDKGSIQKKKRTWTFRTSTNRCIGGVFKQRAEISSNSISPTQKGAYLFRSYVSMKTRSSEKFDIFQVHDARDGCSPPLKVTVLRSGQILLTSDFKTGPGESCVRGQLTNLISKDRIRRDGTEQLLEILVDFDGKGGFEVSIWIDGVFQINGLYRLPPNRGYMVSKKFYFKHGVYSFRVFQYEMKSRDMRVRKVRLKK
jgi:hypothetical protein